MGRKKLALRSDAADAADVIGAMIRQARHDRGWTAEQLADSVGISVRTVRSIETAQPAVSWGHVLNVLSVLRIPLFGMDADEMRRAAVVHRNVVALLPSRTLPPRVDEADDDF